MPGSSVVEHKAFLGHLPEIVESPGVGQAVPQRHLMPGRSFPSVNLSRVGYSLASDFFKVIEITPYQDVIGVEAFLSDFFPDGCPLVGDDLSMDIDDG